MLIVSLFGHGWGACVHTVLPTLTRFRSAQWSTSLRAEYSPGPHSEGQLLLKLCARLGQNLKHDSLRAVAQSQGRGSSKEHI